MKRLFLTLTLILVFAGAGLAQEPVTQPTPSAAPRPTRNQRLFRAEYDRFRDETTMRVGPFTLSSLRALMATDQMLQMFAAFRHSGQSVSEPVSRFYLLFDSSSRSWVFLRNREAYLIIDGERIALGEAEHDGTIGRGLRSVGVRERLIIPLDAETFRRMVEGEKVELRVGPREFGLKDEHKEAFRELIEMARPR